MIKLTRWFDDGVFQKRSKISWPISYALKMLGVPHLILNEEHHLSIQAVYDGKDIFIWLPTSFGKSIW